MITISKEENRRNLSLNGICIVCTYDFVCKTRSLYEKMFDHILTVNWMSENKYGTRCIFGAVWNSKKNGQLFWPQGISVILRKIDFEILIHNPLFLFQNTKKLLLRWQLTWPKTLFSKQNSIFSGTSHEIGFYAEMLFDLTSQIASKKNCEPNGIDWVDHFVRNSSRKVFGQANRTM